MKNLKLFAVLALATSMTATSFGAEVKTATEDKKAEATTESEEQATTEVKETAKAESTQEEDKSNWKTTVIKNPKIIDGRVYLTKEQFMKATGTKFVWHKENGDAVNIERADFMTNIPSYNASLGFIYLNWGIKNPTKFELAKVVKGVKYYPLEAFKSYLNCETKYDKKAKTYTVINKGLKLTEVTTEKINKLKAKVVDKNGKPVVGYKLTVYAEKLTGMDWANGFQEYTTDSNGEFEFEIDTEKVKYFRISGVANEQAGANKKYWLDAPSIATVDSPHLLRTKEKYPVAIIPSNVKTLPTLTVNVDLL